MKVGQFVLRPGDVLRAIGGGGAGLGDPLMRAPELVASDVRDGYITVAHAAAAYGVIADDGGELDLPATSRRRADIRHARIGGQPGREASPPELPGLSVALNGDHGQWSCGYCGAELAPVQADWRQAVAKRVQPITSLFAEIGMHVRERTAEPEIKVAQFYCPSCAGALATDVMTDQRPPRSPALTICR
jgi:N-methylhydantoinase B